MLVAKPCSSLYTFTKQANDLPITGNRFLQYMLAWKQSSSHLRRNVLFYRFNLYLTAPR